MDSLCEILVGLADQDGSRCPGLNDFPLTFFLIFQDAFAKKKKIVQFLLGRIVLPIFQKGKLSPSEIASHCKLAWIS